MQNPMPSHNRPFAICILSYSPFPPTKKKKKITVEPRYNERGPWDHKNYLVISGFSLYQGKKQRNIKSWDQQIYLVIRRFCYIQPLYNEVPLYKKHFIHIFWFWIYHISHPSLLYKLLEKKIIRYKSSIVYVTLYWIMQAQHISHNTSQCGKCWYRKLQYNHYISPRK